MFCRNVPEKRTEKKRQNTENRTVGKRIVYDKIVSGQEMQNCHKVIFFAVSEQS